jgi:hypothetical protein
VYETGGKPPTKLNKMYKAILTKSAINEELAPAFFTDDVIGRIYSETNQQLENYMIEGLKRKGFEFKNRMELENFIKSNCRCEDRKDIKQKTYFVNDIPFFLHYYEIKMDLNITINDKGEVKMSANYGSFAYP